MEKDLKYYMGLNYPVTVENYTEDGETYFSVEIPDLPGCGSYGATLEEAFERLEGAKELWLEESLNRGLDISEPISEEAFSGKFLLRIPSRLHMKLTKNSKSNNISLNQYVKSLLEQSEIADRIHKYLHKNDKKFISILESQSKIIARLEKRIESLEGVFSARYFSQIQHPTEYVSDSPLTGIRGNTREHMAIKPASTDLSKDYWRLER